MATPRSSISPHPPPLSSSNNNNNGHNTTEPPPPAAADTTTDPFLAQTAAIPLTERDRQEGYDVELLNARPRGGGGTYGSDGGDGDSLTGQRGEKYTTPVSNQVLPPVAAVGLPGIGLGAVEGGGAGGGPTSYGNGVGGAGKEFSALNAKEGGGGGGSSGTTARTGRRRPWFLRPLPLGILLAFIVAVALAIGLGVGLSERSRHNAQAAARSRSSSLISGGGSRSRTRSNTRTSSATTGTVVPSSLYSSYTSEHPQSDGDDLSSTLSSDVESTETGSLTTATTEESSITTIPSPASGTTLASTGNLPIPAGSETIISGSITVSRLSGSEATAASLTTITARAKLREKRWTA